MSVDAFNNIFELVNSEKNDSAAIKNSVKSYKMRVTKFVRGLLLFDLLNLSHI